MGQNQTTPAFREVLRIHHDLVARVLENHSFRSGLARTTDTSATQSSTSGLRDQASQLYDAVLKIRARLFQADPADVSSKFRRARSHDHGGLLERALNGLNKPESQHTARRSKCGRRG
jgi:hypothetical protein